MPTKRKDNDSNQPGRRREEQQKKARLHFLLGDYAGARTILSALLKLDPSDKRAKALVEQIEEAERGSGRAASWQTPAQKRKLAFHRAKLYLMDRCREFPGAARDRLRAWRIAVVKWTQQRRNWLANREQRKADWQSWRDSWAEWRREWKAYRAQPRSEEPGWFADWLTSDDRPSRWELFSGGIVSLILIGNLIYFSWIIVQFGWTFPVRYGQRGGYAGYPAWVHALFCAIFLLLLLLFMTRGLLRPPDERRE